MSSALNQPLNATLKLVSLSETEKNSLSVGVADSDMFKRFGIERSPLADELRVAMSATSGTDSVVVRLTTRRPVREPFLRFLIEAKTSEGRALREYTVLLDPPGQPSGSPSPSPAAATSPPQTTPATRTVPVPASVAGSQSSASSSNRYGPVGRGETLFRIASRTRRPGTTQAQMQVAIFRDNPQAFNGSMDLLLSGAMLSIPALEQVAAVSDEQARSAIHEQTSDAARQSAPATKPADTANTTAATLRLEPPRVDGGITGRAGGRGGDGALFGRLVEPDFSSLRSPDRPGPDGTAGSKIDAVVGVAHADVGAVSPSTPAAESGEVLANVATPSAGAAVTTPAAGASDVAAVVDASAVTDAEDSRPLSASERDVVGTAGSGLLRPRNLLILLALVLLIGLLVVRNRRRQYKPVPLEFGADGDDAMQTSAPATPPIVVDREPSPVAMPGGALAGAGGGIAPSVCVQDADRQMKLGLFDGARATLENGLARAPTEPDLQDKLLELEYLAADAGAFKANVARFDAELAGNGVRWAGVAAMGRILLPSDPRFASPGSTPVHPVQTPVPDEPFAVNPAKAATMPPPAQPVAPDPAPRHGQFDADDEGWAINDDENGQQVTAADEPPPARASSVDEALDNAELDADASSSGLSLDTGNPESDDYEWHPQVVNNASERQHDRGDEPGMAFELDTSEFPEDRARPIEAKEAGNTAAAPARPPIDTREFDLGDEDDSEIEGDSQTSSVEIRLDLARMYLDMEDHAAARELLEEAVNEGDETQRRIAGELLDTL